MSLYLCLLLLTLIGNGVTFQFLSLNSDLVNGSWIVENQNKSIRIPAKIPGGIFSDLKDAMILKDDIYYRSNDILYRWVANDSWTFYLNFFVPNEWLDELNELLVFHGVDTVASVSLNGVVISTMLDNMFVRHILNIKGILQRGVVNQLALHIMSPIRAADERSKYWPRVVPDCVPDSYNGVCHANLLRKEQSSFGWDWGPAFPSMGIWKDVEIISYNAAFLRDVTVDLVREEGSWNNIQTVNWVATFTLQIENYHPDVPIKGEGQVVLYLRDGQETGNVTTRKGDSAADGKSKNEQPDSWFADESGDLQLKIRLSIPEKRISLWWPNGVGSQTLYRVKASFKSYGEAYSEISYKELNIGFRSVELVQAPIGTNGLSFYLNVNGLPLFAKGSNWIPPYALPEFSHTLEGRKRVRDLLLSAKEIGVNMLRVWGGGNYESDYFYNLADEYGILIWQDMMFACSMYPVQSEFLYSVATEIMQQVRRLQYHPSVAIWAGNNENEAALRQNWYGTGGNFSAYLNDYSLLYGGVIKPTILKIDSRAVFVMSSPSNGQESMSSQGYVSKNPQSTLFGDIHYYNYFADGWNPFIYPLPRFASEYGYQSMPSMETLRTAGAGDGDWEVNTEFFERRQHLNGGYSAMLIEIKRHLPLTSSADPKEQMENFIYLSQINQAMGLKVETEAYRRGKGKMEFRSQGEYEGSTMGALYWQLNDVWQAPSWSTLEYGGKWKMAHYFAEHFFSTLLPSPVITIDGRLQVYLLSDVPSSTGKFPINCHIIIRVYNWMSPCPVGVKSIPATLPPFSAKLAFDTDLKMFLASSGCVGQDYTTAKRSCFITFQLLFSDKVNEAPANFVFLDSPKNNIDLIEAFIKITSVSDPFPTKDPQLREHYPFSSEIFITSDGIALFVWLEVVGVQGRFSDNGFHLTAHDQDPMCQAFKPEQLRKPTLRSRNYKNEDIDSEPIYCPFDCTELDNSITMAICCQKIREKQTELMMNSFSRTVTFYFKEDTLTSSELLEALTIKYLKME